MDEQIKKLIENYLSGTMSDEKKTEFLKLANDDENIMEELTMQQHLLNTGLHIGRRDLKLELNEIHEDLFPAKKTGTTKTNKIILIFALLAGFGFLASYFLIKGNSVKSTEVLTASYYEPFQLETGKRNVKSNDNSLLINYYTTGQYSEVLGEVNTNKVALEHFPNDVLLSIAISNLEEKSFTEALDVLLLLDAKNDFNIQDEVDWYKSMTFLQMDNRTDLETLLVKIQRDINHDYFSKAESLLKDLQ